MDGWLDGWMDGWMDGWIDGCLVGWLWQQSSESSVTTHIRPSVECLVVRSHTLRDTALKNVHGIWTCRKVDNFT
jgi:hypothetical protein